MVRQMMLQAGGRQLDIRWSIRGAAKWVCLSGGSLNSWDAMPSGTAGHGWEAGANSAFVYKRDKIRS